jgi:hypothetical protein
MRNSQRRIPPLFALVTLLLAAVLGSTTSEGRDPHPIVYIELAQQPARDLTEFAADDPSLLTLLTEIGVLSIERRYASSAPQSGPTRSYRLLLPLDIDPEAAVSVLQGHVSIHRAEALPNPTQPEDFLTDGQMPPYVPGLLAIKFTFDYETASGNAETGSKSLDIILRRFLATSMSRMNSQIPISNAMEKEEQRRRDRLQHLNQARGDQRVLLVSFPTFVNMETAARELKAHPLVEWANPVYHGSLE